MSTVSPFSSVAFGIGARRQQPLDHRRAAVRARQVQRRGADVVGRVGTGARANQQIRDGEIIDMRGPVQRGGAIPLRRIHVGALFEQRPHGLDVLASHRLDQPRSPQRTERTA